jgi:hypothetical protein
LLGRVFGVHRWPVWWMIVGLLIAGWAAAEGGREGLKIAVIASGPVLFWAVTVPVGWTGCRTLVRERQLDTLDGLLLTAIEPADVVFQKWAAAVLAARGRVLAAAAVWLVGLLAGATTPPGVLALAATTAANAALAASLGVLCSVTSATARGAVAKLTLGAIGWTIGLGCCVSGMAGGIGSGVVLFGAAVPIAPQSFAGALGAADTGEEFGILFGLVILGTVLSSAVALVTYTSAALTFTEQTRPVARRRI